VLPGLVSMKANTALAFVLIGIALGLATMGRGRAASAIACASAIGLILIGGATLVEYAFSWNLGIDELIVVCNEPRNQSPYAGRPAPATAACILMLGIALVLLPPKRTLARAIAQFLAVCVLLISGLAIVGYMLWASIRYTEYLLLPRWRSTPRHVPVGFHRRTALAP